MARLSLWQRFKAWLVAPSLEEAAFKHWVPPHNSVQGWQAGPGRCFYCLTHEDDPEFMKLCPRIRPGTPELA